MTEVQSIRVDACLAGKGSLTRSSFLGGNESKIENENEDEHDWRPDEGWLEELAQQLRTKTYCRQAVRRVNIPKGVTEVDPTLPSFSQGRQFLFLSSDPSVRNFKFLAGNVITDGDINSVAQHLTKELSMALYALGTLWLRMFPMRY
jgi:hypothetical protein